MLGDRVKALREARAWTQEHLADAAGVSLRTIQRLETGAGFASETALAVAAALDVDVRELLEPGEKPTGDTLWRPLPGAIAIVFAVAMALPALLYFGANLLRHGAGMAIPDAAIPDSLMVLIGGPALALLLLLLASVQPRGSWSGGRLTLTGVMIRPRTAPMLVAAGTIAAIGVAILFLAGKTVGHLARVVGL